MSMPTTTTSSPRFLPPPRVLAAAAVRPLHLVVLGAGLVFALAGAPWWTFPLALVPYAAMVLLCARDPRFAARALAAADGLDTDGAQDAADAVRDAAGAVAGADLRGVLARVGESAARLRAQVASAPPSLRPVLAASLEQVRSAARLGAALARRVDELDAALTAMDPARARAEAHTRRQWAARATDADARREFLDAAAALEESAHSAEALAALRQKTFAQLDHLAASLDNALVRSVRIRVASDNDEGARAVSDALRVDVETLRETLAVFEESTPAGGAAARPARRREAAR